MVTVGDNGTNVAELGEYFQYRDVTIIALASCFLGASGAYLLTTDRSDTESRQVRVGTEQTATAPSADGGTTLEPSSELLEARKREWEQTADRLADKEREVYQILLEADGVLPQGEIVDESDLSKASVSRALDSLEVKNLVERKRRGMGNVVLLQ